MTTVFIGGSRHVSRLLPEVQRKLNTIVEKRLPILIGDANGADKAVQQYLHGKQYANVEVFCAGSACRNNIGNWNLRRVFSETREGTFDFYAEKDRLMSQQATIGLMIWDGKSVGTLLNVLRLLRKKKKVVVYHVPERRFWELRRESEWVPFVSRCNAQLRNKVEQKASLEERSQQPNQTSLLTEPL
ncbi:MAG: hypothetical protein ACLQAT_15365 [Candidatus Binataceae bacterium]